MSGKFKWSSSLVALMLTFLVSASASAQTWFDPAWGTRVQVDLTEPGIADRPDEYVDVTVDFSSAPFTDLSTEVRVADAAGTELPSLVHSIQGSTAHVVFPKTIAQGATETVYIYWNNPQATAPSYTFPAVEGAFYGNPGYNYASDVTAVAGLNALQAWGKIPLNMPEIDATASYDRAATLQRRLAGISALCVVHDFLKTTTIYDDIAMWGFTRANCLEQRMFGLTNGGDESVMVNAVGGTYITQDFSTDEQLSFDCDEGVIPDTGSHIEGYPSSNAAHACHLRWEPGHTLPNGKTLRYRSFFSGEEETWNADNITIYTRTFEHILQDNRVTLTTGPVEQNLTADAKSVTTDEDVVVNVALSGSTSNGPLSYRVVGLPANGTLGNVDSATGDVQSNPVTYTPDADFNGTDTFEYVAIDANGGVSDPATVTVTVTPINDAPVAADDTLTTDEDTDGTITINGLLANDDDVDGDALTVSGVTMGTNGQVALDTNTGLVTYTPDADFHGADAFTYTVQDGNGESATATVDVTVEPINDAPVAQDLTVTTDEDTSVVIALAATDVDGDALTYTYTLPQNGTLTGTGSSLTYTPEADFHGADTFEYTVVDGNGGADTASVTITVNPVNDAPLFVDPTPADATVITVTDGALVTFTVAAEDADGDAVTLSVTPTPEGASFDASSGAFDWTPSWEQAGSHTLTLEATDGQATAARSLTVEISIGDADEDGLPDSWEESVGLDPTTKDSDGDTIADADEVGDDLNAPVDTDSDGTLDALDDDSDDDGVTDADEAGDDDLATEPVDTNDDGTPDYRDSDSDDDTVDDGQDNCRLVNNPEQTDTDEDGVGDACVDDIDGDTVVDADDNCPSVANMEQLDVDEDGVGDACDDTDDRPSTSSGAAEDGCGCRSVHTHQPLGAHLAIVLAGLLGLVAVRRRWS
ncbi:tandem-95 repeat protein [Persicimonas caeni]|uniref:Tandem-95 repeat protein n=1 Tax=Persicimonas caeni TaxID=2292766 RepID=A0A4Y6PQI6_PERCE|nr:tandem-95 repeat protein [Persicimonas caeni]QDG50602.1 tandem-95 repeat protein [Persicimonas caeni]QED31823.1 tandem-95 repeat protein [Persicimonas caeni]